MYAALAHVRAPSSSRRATLGSSYATSIALDGSRVDAARHHHPRGRVPAALEPAARTAWLGAGRSARRMDVVVLAPHRPRHVGPALADLLRAWHWRQPAYSIVLPHHPVPMARRTIASDHPVAWCPRGRILRAAHRLGRQPA